MGSKKLLLLGLGNALGTLIYVSLVAWLMSNGERLFGPEPGPGKPWGFIAFLLLFVLSAIICGLLILGRPAWLYLNNYKKEGAELLVFTVIWLLVITMIVFLLLIGR